MNISKCFECIFTKEKLKKYPAKNKKLFPYFINNISKKEPLWLFFGAILVFAIKIETKFYIFSQITFYWENIFRVY